MLPTSRCIGGVTRPRDLRTFSKSRGAHLERLPVHQSLSDTDIAVAPGRVAGSSRSSDVASRSAYSVPQQTRRLHTSSSVSYDSSSYNGTDVPEFFVKYKQYRVPSGTGVMMIHELKPEQSGMMQALTDAIATGDIVATTRRLKAKIPVEHPFPEGHVVHPSGFVVPGPGHASTSDVARAKERERNERKDRLVQTAAVAHSVIESGFEQVNATTLPASHKIPFEVCEQDGIIKHPSGFVPPTPAHKFRHMVNSNMLWERKVSVVRQHTRQASPSRALLRAMHMASAPKASKDA